MAYPEVGDVCPTRLRVGAISYMLGHSSYAYTWSYLNRMRDVEKVSLPPRERGDEAWLKAIEQDPIRFTGALVDSHEAI